MTYKDLSRVAVSQGERVKVLVAFSESPSRFWIQLESEKQKIDDILNQMFDFYSESTDESLKPAVVSPGDAVAALYPEDESWYRARVESVEGEQVTVMFLDHGNTETVGLDNIRRLSQAFTALPIQVRREA